ncbi:MAG: methionyl-tRNA formyltransferase [Acidobacteria bacterium]|nr:methionyl-tRNA formyltransferase [Acidobacteriota bacterium]
MGLRILFMGTPEFAVPSLEQLAGWNKDAIAGVVSQPDKPQGRGRHMRETPVKRTALKHGLLVFQPAKIKSEEGERLLARLAPDLVIVVAYGQILPKWFLDFPQFGAINVHASLLPFYRGAAPLQHALLNGEKTTGITLMLMDEGMDTGPVINQMEFLIYENETAGELAARASALSADFLVRELPRYLRGDRKAVPQDSNRATYAPLLKKEEGRMQFEHSNIRLHNLVRAMNPWPTAFCTCQDQRLFVHRTYLQVDSQPSGVPGEFVGMNQDAMLVQCGTGLLALSQVQAAGKKIVSGRDFANGLRLVLGFRFSNG